MSHAQPYKQHRAPRVLGGRITRASIAMLALLALALMPMPAAAVVYYTFASEHGGGIAVLDVDVDADADDPEDAKVRRHEVIFRESGFSNPHKLAVSEDGQTLVMVNEGDAQNVAVVKLDEAGIVKSSHLLAVPGEPDAVKIFGHRALIGADKGHVTLINLRTRSIEKQINTRKLLDPPGHEVEDIVIAPDADFTVFSLQKDQSGQKSLGNRLVLVELPTLEVICDLQLPRNKPELHNPNNDKEQGPGPEVIVLQPELNRLGVSMDFYGGFAITDLDAALRDEPGEVTYLSTAPDGAWGTAFPDRLSVFPHPDAEDDAPHELVMILNSGQVGGGCVIDLTRREVVARFDCPPGLETATYLPSVGLIAATHHGKVKTITPEKVSKAYKPSARVFVYDVRRLDAFDEPRIVELPDAAYRLEAIDPARSSLVAVTHGQLHTLRGDDEQQAAAAQRISVIDAATGEVLTTLQAHGEPRRLVRR